MTKHGSARVATEPFGLAVPHRPTGDGAVQEWTGSLRIFHHVSATTRP